MGLAGWYWKHNSFWNEGDRRRHRARQAQKRKAAAAQHKAAAQARLRHEIDAAVQQHLASTGRSCLTKEEVRNTELEMRKTGMSNAEISERMKAIRFWQER